MKIAVLGGSFNPIHNGHLIAANEVLITLGFDKIIFVPAFIAPHKEIIEDIKPSDRIEMVRLATEDDNNFLVEDFEINKGGLSYTIETIQYIREKYNISDCVSFIIGDDLIETLPLWHKVEELAKIVRFVVVTRDSSFESLSKRMRYEANYLRIPHIEISSTMIRNRIGEKISCRYLLPNKVYSYIKEKSLYGKVKPKK